MPFGRLGDQIMNGLVTIVQPAGFPLGVFASSVATATFAKQGHAANGMARNVATFMPLPVIEQRRFAVVGRA